MEESNFLLQQDHQSTPAEPAGQAEELTLLEDKTKEEAADVALTSTKEALPQAREGAQDADLAQARGHLSNIVNEYIAQPSSLIEVNLTQDPLVDATQENQHAATQMPA